MDKNLTGETLLIVEGKHDAKVVKGEFNKDGSPKTVLPKDKNKPDFLKIDKHGNVLENFFTNFMRQSKDPTRFMFFKVPISGIEALATVITDMLKEGYESSKAMLEEYRIRPEEHVDKAEKQDANAEKKR